MARMITTTPTGEQLTLDLFPTLETPAGAPESVTVYAQGDVAPLGWIEARTKPGTKSTRQFRPVWMHGTARTTTPVWSRTRELAVRGLLGELHHLATPGRPGSDPDRLDPLGLNLELVDGKDRNEFVVRDGATVGLIIPLRSGWWHVETADGIRRTSTKGSRRAALEELAIWLGVEHTAPGSPVRARVARLEREQREQEQLTAELSAEPAPACECAAELLSQGYHTAGCPLVVELHAAMDDSAPARDALDAARAAVEAAEEGSPEHAAAWDAHGEALEHLKTVNARLGAAIDAAAGDLEDTAAALQLRTARPRLPEPLSEEQLHLLRSRARLNRLHLEAAHARYSRLLDERAELAYQLQVAGVSQSAIGEDFGVSRQMAARLAGRGWQLAAADISPEPLEAPRGH